MNRIVKNDQYQRKLEFEEMLVVKDLVLQSISLFDKLGEFTDILFVKYVQLKESNITICFGIHCVENVFGHI